VDTQWVLAVVLLGIAMALVACGGDDDAAPDDTPEIEISGDAHPADVEVIAGWTEALAGGDVEAAAAYFATPSVAENGILYEIEDEDDALRFNASLPCGAELIGAETQGEFTTATFRLKERPGPGVCGDGVGGTAQTAFVIEGSKIVEWRRVGLPGSEGPSTVS
jgi:hypothetical protein